MDDDGRLAGAPGLCGTCRHAMLRATRRGTAYLRCARAADDDRFVKYPRLPMRSCVGYEAEPDADADA